MYQKIESVIEALDTSSIPKKRKEELESLVDYMLSKKEIGSTINLNFICTHNSRRSHLAQIWAQTMAFYFGINKVFCFSGGTEATALFISVKETLERKGFVFKTISEGNNPKYKIYFSDAAVPVLGFSKTYNDKFNPENNFAAIMTCSQADENCPLISGSEKRIPITYQDPKEFDKTPIQKEKYKERSQQIATEMKYVFSLLK